MIKKNLKKILIVIAILLLVSISLGIGVYADYVLNAIEVQYTKSDGTTVGVDEALDDLYAAQHEVETFLGYTGNTKASDLKVGDSIRYYYKNGTTNANFICRVLYNDSTHGIQVVAAVTVGSNITLGANDPKIPSSLENASDFEKATWSYNNAVYTLNEYAMEYVTEGGMAVDGRCVGSNPLIGKKNSSESSPQMVVQNDPSGSEREWVTSNGWYNMFKLGDGNSNAEVSLLRTNSTFKISNKDYWTCWRLTESQTGSQPFVVRMVYKGGSTLDRALCEIRSTGAVNSNSFSAPLRPVFRLKPEIFVNKI